MTCDLIVRKNTDVVYITCDIHIPRIKGSSKGSNLIHATSAEFSHIALKLPPFAYPSA